MRRWLRGEARGYVGSHIDPNISIDVDHPTSCAHRAAERASQKKEERLQDFVAPPEEKDEGAAAAGAKKGKGAKAKGKGGGAGEGKQKSLRELSAGLLAKKQPGKRPGQGQSGQKRALVEAGPAGAAAGGGGGGVGEPKKHKKRK